MCRDAYRMVTAKTEETIERYKAAEKKTHPKYPPLMSHHRSGLTAAAIATDVKQTKNYRNR
ncbi:MAG: hypothetical protein FWE53_02675 [Firmicutes bacterium]|nr:hypothetical protein [Bacillota bacterium]